MLTSFEDYNSEQHRDTDVVIVGAGPVGIVLALELGRRGAKVLVVESGLTSFGNAHQDLARAGSYDPAMHAEMTLAVRRQLGGTSTIWGGRCLPYDPLDFQPRAYVPDSEWPVTYEELVPYFARACSWTGCGRPVFDASQIPRAAEGIVPGFPSGRIASTALERWSLPTHFGREYLHDLKSSSSVTVVLGLTCVGIVVEPEGSTVSGLECRSLDGEATRLSGSAYVLAAGGLESTRLLLASPRSNGHALGDHSGHLGRWYMGHLEGDIARIHFNTDPRDTIFGFENDVDGVYVRRRITVAPGAQSAAGIGNFVAWLANPELQDSSHRSGVLSFVYLVLRSPLGRLLAPAAQRMSLTGERVPGSPYGTAPRSRVLSHLGNIIRRPRSTLSFIVDFGRKRFLSKRRAPGFFVSSQANIYPLHYQAEHRPNFLSRVALSDAIDQLGMPRLAIDIRFSEDDIADVIKAHNIVDEELRSSGCGHLEYVDEDLRSAIRSRLGGGFHQIGTTRMAASAADGVVDPNLKVYGTDNLYVASSSSFVTSGQANSTFMTIVFALRLADHLMSTVLGDPE